MIERGEQGRSPCGEKGQRDSRCRDEPRRDGHVQEGLQTEGRGEPERDRGGETVLRQERNAEAPPGEQAEEAEDEQRAEEPCLLSDDRVNEVRVRHGQGTQLCRAAAQPLAEKPAAHERGLCRDDLVPGPRAVGGEIEERKEALDTVLPGEKEKETKRNREERHEEEMQEAHLRDVHHRQTGDKDEDRRRVVVLEKNDPGEHTRDDEGGNERVHRDSFSLAAAGKVRGKVENQGQFHKLRRLEGESHERNPPSRTENGSPQPRQEGKQDGDEGPEEDQRHPSAEDFQRSQGHDKRRRAAEGGPDELPLQEEERVVIGPGRERPGAGEEERHADPENQDQEHDKEHVAALFFNPLHSLLPTVSSGSTDPGWQTGRRESKGAPPLCFPASR